MPPRANEQLLQSLPFGCFLLDSAGTIVFANDRAHRLSGAGSGDLVGQPFFTESRLGAAAAALESRVREDVIRCVGSSFSTVELKTPAEPSRFKLHSCPLQADGESLALLLLEPLKGDDELHDEIERLHERLHRIGMQRHEINNLLMGLMGHAELLRDSSDQSGTDRKRVHQILEQSRRILEQIKQMGSARDGGRS